MFGKLKGWFVTLSLMAKIGVGLASLVVLGTVAIAASGPAVTKPPMITTPQPPPPAVKGSATEIKTITVKVPILFTTTTVPDNTLPQGTTATRVQGVNGEETQIWRVTYVNGTETNRTLVSEALTTQPTEEVIAQSTKAPTPPVVSAPTNCPNGTYTNTAGNEVCSPSNDPSPGASAQCRDGTYSFSQSRSGTCSHHGGVARWF